LLTYSEPVDPHFSSFTLYDVQGKKLSDLTPALQDGGLQVLLSLQPPLASGVYTMAWHVLSAADGHITEGTFPFSVGVAISSSPVEHATQIASNQPISTAIVRWLGLLAMLLIVGSLFFPLLLSRAEAIVEESRVAILLWASWGVLMLAGAAGIVFQAQLLKAPPLSVLLQSQWGTIQLAKYSFALALGILLGLGLRDRFGRWLARGLALVLLLSTSLSGHSAALGPLGILADSAHQLAAALWLGGLAQLALIWIPRRSLPEEKAVLMSKLVPRFSQLALISVILLLATGLYGALNHIPSWSALISTSYGRYLLAKVLLLLSTLGLAVINRRVMTPQIGAWSQVPANPGLVPEAVQRTLSRFHRLVGSEMFIIAVIVLFASLLTLSAPPMASDNASALSARSQLFVQPWGHYTIALTVSPVQVGTNTFDVTMADSAGMLPQGIQRVWLDFNDLDQDLGTVSADAQPTAPGHYRLQGPFFSLVGHWQVTVWVRIKGQANDLKAQFTLPVGNAPTNHKPELSPQQKAASHVRLREYTYG
jgi:copper transport protein